MKVGYGGPSDIVERLSFKSDTDSRDAMLEIERLRAELVKAREALSEIEYLDRPQVRGQPRRVSIGEIARAALEAAKREQRK